MRHSRYAQVAWTADDVLTLRPEWTAEQAEEWLEFNERYVRDRLVELGWGVIDTLLGYEPMRPEDLSGIPRVKETP